MPLIVLWPPLTDRGTMDEADVAAKVAEADKRVASDCKLRVAALAGMRSIAVVKHVLDALKAATETAVQVELGHSLSRHPIEFLQRLWADVSPTGTSYHRP